MGIPSQRFCECDPNGADWTPDGCSAPSDFEPMADSCSDLPESVGVPIFMGHPMRDRLQKWVHTKKQPPTPRFHPIPASPVFYTQNTELEQGIEYGRFGKAQSP